MLISGAIEKAVALNEQGQIGMAVDCLDAIAADIPNQLAYQKLVGMLYQSLGEDDKSFRFLRWAFEKAPDDAEIQLALGYHYMDNGEPARATGHFAKAAQARPESVDALTMLGRAYDFERRFVNAEQALRRGMEVAPTAAGPAIHLGRVLTRDGRAEEARDMFRALLDGIAPANVLAEMGLRRAEYLIAHGDAAPSGWNADRPATVVCVKHGTLYGPEYANRLAAMVRRNADSDVRFVCFTEDPVGLADGVEHRPLPAENLQGWWNKVALFKPDLADIGERILFFDLDVVITGSIEPLLRCESDFAIMDNDYVPGYNTSVMLLRTGARPDVWDNFSATEADKFGGDQDWVAINAPDGELWPDGWRVPYRLRAAKAPPPDCKVVCFCGRPNPDKYPAPLLSG